MTDVAAVAASKVASLFRRRKTAKELVDAVIEALAEPDAETRNTNLNAAITFIKQTIVGDGERDTLPDNIDELSEDIMSSKLFEQLVNQFSITPLEVNKATVLIFTHLLHREVNGQYPAVESITRSNPELLTALVNGYQKRDTAMLCGPMLQALLLYSTMVQLMFDANLVLRFFEYIESPEFEIASDAFQSFSTLMTAHPVIVQTYLHTKSEELMTRWLPLLQKDNYLVQRQLLSLLAQLLPLQPDFCALFLASAEHLKMMMMMMADKRALVAMSAFDVFKLFVLAETKSKAVANILFKNKERMAGFLETFQPNQTEAPFVEAKAAVLAALQALEFDTAAYAAEVAAEQAAAEAAAAAAAKERRREKRRSKLERESSTMDLEATKEGDDAASGSPGGSTVPLDSISEAAETPVGTPATTPAVHHHHGTPNGTAAPAPAVAKTDPVAPADAPKTEGSALNVKVVHQGNTLVLPAGPVVAPGTDASGAPPSPRNASPRVSLLTQALAGSPSAGTQGTPGATAASPTAAPHPVSPHPTVDVTSKPVTASPGPGPRAQTERAGTGRVIAFPEMNPISPKTGDLNISSAGLNFGMAINPPGLTRAGSTPALLLDPTTLLSPAGSEPAAPSIASSLTTHEVSNLVSMFAVGKTPTGSRIASPDPTGHLLGASVPRTAAPQATPVGARPSPAEAMAALAGLSIPGAQPRRVADESDDLNGSASELGALASPASGQMDEPSELDELIEPVGGEPVLVSNEPAKPEETYAATEDDYREGYQAEGYEAEANDIMDPSRGSAPKRIISSLISSLPQLAKLPVDKMAKMTTSLLQKTGVVRKVTAADHVATALAALNDTNMESRNANLTAAITGLRVMVLGDGEKEPNPNEVSAVCEAIMDAELLSPLLISLPTFPLETQKATVAVVTSILRHRDTLGNYVVASFIDRKNPELLEMLATGGSGGTMLLFGAITQVALQFAPLCTHMLYNQSIYKYMENAMSPEFEVSADAFAILNLMLTRHQNVASEFLSVSYDKFTERFVYLMNPMEEYVVLRQSLSILVTLLDQQPGFRARFVQNADFLKMTMNSLNNKQQSIQLLAFEIFSYFVNEPVRAPLVNTILVNNRRKLVTFFESFLLDKAETAFHRSRQAMIAAFNAMDADGGSTPSTTTGSPMPTRSGELSPAPTTDPSNVNSPAVDMGGMDLGDGLEADIINSPQVTPSTPESSRKMGHLNVDTGASNSEGDTTALLKSIDNLTRTGNGNVLPSPASQLMRGAARNISEASTRMYDILSNMQGSGAAVQTPTPAPMLSYDAEPIRAAETAPIAPVTKRDSDDELLYPSGIWILTENGRIPGSLRFCGDSMSFSPEAGYIRPPIVGAPADAPVSSEFSVLMSHISLCEKVTYEETPLAEYDRKTASMQQRLVDQPPVVNGTDHDVVGISSGLMKDATPGAIDIPARPREPAPEDSTVAATPLSSSAMPADPEMMHFLHLEVDVPGKPNTIIYMATIGKLIRDAVYARSMKACHARLLRPTDTSSSISLEEIHKYRPAAIGISGGSSIVDVDRLGTLLATWLPTRIMEHRLKKIFDTGVDGCALSTLYRRAAGIHPLILLVQTTDRAVFGAFISTEIVPESLAFYGTGETFLFSIEPTAARYTWDVNASSLFVRSSSRELVVGGGSTGTGLRLDAELLHGSSEPSTTFSSPSLSATTEFTVASVELFGISL